jgi:hypothetical protein
MDAKTRGVLVVSFKILMGFIFYHTFHRKSFYIGHGENRNPCNFVPNQLTGGWIDSEWKKCLAEASKMLKGNLLNFCLLRGKISFLMFLLKKNIHAKGKRQLKLNSFFSFQKSVQSLCFLLLWFIYNKLLRMFRTIIRVHKYFITLGSIKKTVKTGPKCWSQQRACV